MKTFSDSLTPFDKQILAKLFLHTIIETQEISQTDLGLLLPVEDAKYGPAYAVSRRLPHLRKHGAINDVALRCNHCGSALTRGQQNTPIKLTPLGQEFGRAWHVQGL